MTTENESAPANGPEGIEEPDASHAAAEAAAAIDEPTVETPDADAPAAFEGATDEKAEMPPVAGESLPPAEAVAAEPDISEPVEPVEAVAAEPDISEPAEAVADNAAMATADVDEVVSDQGPSETPDAQAGSEVDAAADAAKEEEEKEIFIRAERPAIVARSVSDLSEEMLANDFAAAIEHTVLEFKEGDIIEGTVASVDQDEVLVDIGYKSEGHIPLKELSIRHGINPLDVVSVGDRIEALVLDKEDDEGRLILSKKRVDTNAAWGRIQRIHAEAGTVTGPVIEVVKGGLIVDIGLRGFLPASLVELRRVRDLEPYVGQEIEAKVIELDRNRNNVVPPAGLIWKNSRPRSARRFSMIWPSVRFAPALFLRWSISALSLISVAWTVWSTCRSCRSST